ncbi:MAG: GntR family transcriptional regulator [Armatimonadota bacterium]
MAISEFYLDSDLVRPQSLGDKVADIIRDKIISGEYASGMRLTEDGFAKALGISRPCVKEAFLMLESEGLVTRRVRNKYTEVVTFTKQDIEEIVSLRASIEALCAETCIIKHTIPIDEMQRRLQILTPLSNAGHRDKDHVLADLAFHQVIIDSSGNGRAIDVWNSLESQMKTLMVSVIQGYPEKLLMMVDSHREIMQAMVDEDIEKTVDLIKEHIIGNKTLLLNLFEKR